MSTKTEAGREVRKAMLQMIRAYKREHGYFPAGREIEETLDISRGAFLWHLSKLAEQGYLSYEPGRFSRTLRLSRKNIEALQ